MRALQQRAQLFKAAGGNECSRARARATAVVTSRLGGGGSLGGGSSNAPRLIIPGQSGGSSSGGGGSLIIPGQSGRSAGGAGQAPAMQQNFRPPPGFMDGAEPPQEEQIDLPPEVMINRLRAGAGHWHELARLLPALQRKGIDAVAVEEETGLERKLQNIWTSAAQVYDSVKRSGELSDAELAVYDAEGEHLLYELRYLSVVQRVPAAKYVVAQGLSDAECVVLARAIKEHERRRGEREGFAATPGDCLAYKFYRDAQECRKAPDVEACVKKGLAVAETDSAREKLTSLLGEPGAAAGPTLPEATLNVVRLTREELGFRPVAVAGSLHEATADAVAAAPKVSAEGMFSNFRLPAEGVGHEWVGLPSWSIVAQAANPVALTIENCASVPEICTAAFVKTEEDRKRLAGVGLLVADTVPDGGSTSSTSGASSSVDPTKYYLLRTAQGGVRLAAGGDVADAGAVIGTVLFLCRPPQRESAASQTSELLSM